MIEILKKQIIAGNKITFEQAASLLYADLDRLCRAADEIRKHFCANSYDICTITNGKSGRCTENCKFCAQSSHYDTIIEDYNLLDTETLLQEAVNSKNKGILRHAVVTSGRKLNKRELEQMCASYKKISASVELDLCASHGLLNYSEFLALKNSGVKRYHNNLETSRRNFPHICTTHTYEEKIQAIKNAQKAGLQVCSGGIIGIGETNEDRLSLAFELRALNVKSIPINTLNAILNTPFEHFQPLEKNEVVRTFAIYRFINPDAFIRLAGGRISMQDKGKSLFGAGANALISGEMLTTNGFSIEGDLKMLAQLGFTPQKKSC